ncbi:MAG: hypothetical protein H6719_18665 [Sandaracinaceae bacterium]|nr:hypothetical protein [Sandaracinaceae bacterium]
MRTTLALVASLTLSGCLGMLSGTDEMPVDGDPTMTPPPEGSWDLSIDTSASDIYLEPATTTSTIRGHITASEGVQRAELGPAGTPSAAPVDTAGSFSAPMTVGPGYSLVEVRGYDQAGHMANGHRSVLRADYAPEWELLGDTAVIAADAAMLDALGSSAGALLGGIDLASFVTVGSPLMENSTCHLYVDSVTAGTPTLSLSPTEDGRLRATARVPDIAVGFSGNCNALGTAITVREGSEADETTVELSMILEPIPPPPGECVSGFTATDVNLQITSFDLDLRLAGCGLLCLAGELIGEIAEGAVKGMIEDRFMGQVGPLVDPLLRDLRVLDETTTMDFLETPVEVGLCLTGLSPSPEGQLMASIGTRVRGPGGVGLAAPGAPYLAATPPPGRAGTMQLDPALVSQILFSVWNGGAFALPDVSALGGDDGGGDGLGFTIDTLTGLVPQLRPMIQDGRIMRGAPLVIGVDAQMAPLVRAANPEEAAAGVDMFIELGDLRLSLGTAGGTLFEIGTHVVLALSLEPTADGALAPVLVESASSSTTWIVDSAIRGLPSRSADSLTDLVNGLIVSQLSPLLSGAAITLPDLGVPLAVGDVSPDPGGYLVVELSVGATPPPAP